MEGEAPDRFQESYSIQLMNGSMPRVILVYNQVIKSFFNMQKLYLGYNTELPFTEIVLEVLVPGGCLLSCKVWFLHFTISVALKVNSFQSKITGD